MGKLAANPTLQLDYRPHKTNVKKILKKKKKKHSGTLTKMLMPRLRFHHSAEKKKLPLRAQWNSQALKQRHKKTELRQIFTLKKKYIPKKTRARELLWPDRCMSSLREFANL